MHGPGKFAYIILGILLLIDVYTFRGILQFSQNWSSTIKVIAGTLYWLIPAFIVFMVFFIMGKMDSLSSGKTFYRVFYTFMGVMVLFYVPKMIFSAFLIGNDLVNGTIFLLDKFNLAHGVSNFRFLRVIGAVLALFLFVFTFYGIVIGKYQYKITKHKIESVKIPPAFEGFRIVQLSDWHIGSYYGKRERIAQAVDRINALNPDLILFTGDLVNNLASEVDEFIPELKRLEAKHGIYSVMGNHDYGDYVRWNSQEERNKNIQDLKDTQKAIGFKMLNNQSETIQIDSQKIALIGVENWGLPPFPQHGDLKTAINGTASVPFKILMSHDPSHWESEVKAKTDIDLTLSGHTHGMQFGFRIKNLKWSPVKFKYPNWAGMYTHDNQKLYVNVGIGYIGFPGRVGMRPEISVFELQPLNKN